MLADSQIHRQTTALPKLRPKALYKCDYYYHRYYYSRLLITISVPVQGADYNHQTVTDSERPGGAAVLSAVLRQRRRFIGATTTTTDYLAHRGLRVHVHTGDCGDAAGRPAPQGCDQRDGCVGTSPYPSLGNLARTRLLTS